MSTYRISNFGEDSVTIVKELTEEQYEFLYNLFKELNYNCGRYAPYIAIYKETATNDKDIG